MHAGYNVDKTFQVKINEIGQLENALHFKYI